VHAGARNCTKVHKGENWAGGCAVVCVAVPRFGSIRPIDLDWETADCADCADTDWMIQVINEHDTAYRTGVNGIRKKPTKEGEKRDKSGCAEAGAC